MRSVPLAALLILLCPPTLASAGDDYVPAADLGGGQLTPAEIARRAERIYATHCERRTAEEVRRNTSALAAVSAEWASVASYYETVEKRTYLMYWRGMLAYCLDRPEEAGEDLTGFLKLEGANQGFAALSKEAARVLRQLGKAVPKARILDEAEHEEGGDVGGPDPSAVASAASLVHGEHCANLSHSQTATVASSMAAVAKSLEAVEGAWRSSHEPYLMYWKGLLELCIGSSEVGASSLQRFLSSDGDRSVYAEMIRDARRRLKHVPGARAARGGSRAPQSGAGEGAVVVPGIVLGVIGGVFGGLSAWQWQTSREWEDELYAGPFERKYLEEVVEEGEQAVLRSQIFLGVGVGLGAGAVLAWIVGGVTKNATPTTVWLGPGPAVAGPALGFSGSF